ncbi:glycosyltransferase family 61 protein [Acinetobacter sp.]|jgi:capsular polysaccharide biosynthesis protein|uniref:glycosyltransferase family 61 protein n=1 Tax=Acinetobacter sp. TaxID=472 RepID=UPI00282C976C|nr:glycosyltransferase family 61 protein [Acinetobacter sp.]MDR2251074.1 glycosyltransferase family 61 protein [Acinetobacter sp.]
MINRFIKNYLFNHNFQINLFLKFLLKRLKNIEIHKLQWIDQNKNILKVLKDQSEVLSYSPKFFIKENTISKVNIPATILYELKNVLIQTRSSHIIYKNSNTPIMERVLDSDINYSDYSTGYIRYHNDEFAAIKHEKKELITLKENTLFIGGNGVYNYYHWLIEIAPKILLLTPEILNQYSIKDIVLDESIKNTPSLKEILDIFMKHKKIKLNTIYINTSKDIFIEKLHYINNRNNFVFNSRNVLSATNKSCYCPELIQTIREACFKYSNEIKTTIKYEKIFLMRKEGSVRSYNQEETINFFSKYGFQAIYLEDYNFLEQINIFSHAKFIVGPSGAAWSNIIFCQPNTMALSWLPNTLSDFSVFSTLAHIVKCNMQFIFAKPADTSEVHSNYYLNIVDLEKTYKAML